MKIKRIKLLEEHLIELEKKHKSTSETLANLLEYLTHVDANFENNTVNFESWHTKLNKIRHDEIVVRELQKARRVLADHGYVVAASEQELDAARVKSWVSSKDALADDDIPF